MKKYIAMALAAGGLTFGAAASAQTLGTVMGNIFGYGAPSTPAVVAGTVPYGSAAYPDAYGRQVYIDQYGRQVHLDSYGRQVIVQPSQSYGIIGYETNGQPIYGTIASGNYAYANPQDRDRDGVINRHDRWPDDPRYR
jgi:hypothetical protein